MQSNPNNPNPNPNPYGSTSYGGGYSDNPYASDPYSRQPSPADPTVPASSPYGSPTPAPPPQPYGPPSQPQPGYFPQQPQQPGYFQQQQPYGSGQYPPPQPPVPQRSGGGRTLLIVLAVLVVLLGAGAAIGIPAKINIDNTNATATATTAKNTEATATANVQATATAIANTYPFSSELVFNDPLKDNSGGHGWQIEDLCTFDGGTYHAISDQTNTYVDCVALKTSFSNFTYQVDAQLLKGDSVGIAFRENFQAKQFYMFHIRSDNTYAIWYRGGKDAKAETLKTGKLSGVDVTQVNQIGVVARGNKMTMYVNQKEITSITDDALTQGQIGVVAHDRTTLTEAIFSNVKVWKLP